MPIIDEVALGQCGEDGPKASSKSLCPKQADSLPTPLSIPAISTNRPSLSP